MQYNSIFSQLFQFIPDIVSKNPSKVPGPTATAGTSAPGGSS